MGQQGTGTLKDLATGRPEDPSMWANTMSWLTAIFGPPTTPTEARTLSEIAAAYAPQMRAATPEERLIDSLDDDPLNQARAQFQFSNQGPRGPKPPPGPTAMRAATMGERIGDRLNAFTDRLMPAWMHASTVRDTTVPEPFFTRLDPTMGSAAPGKVAAKGIKAYHGSPHDFDQFSLSKIGTGEGAQAYGHGLYFAETEGVARDYQKKLSGLLPEGWSDKYPESARAYIRGVVGDVADGRLTPEQAAKHVSNANSVMRDYPADRLAAEIADGAKGVKGRMYEVNIHADPDDFLDWDAPLSQQSETVRDAVLKSEGFAPRTGAALSDVDRQRLGYRDAMTLRGQEVYGMGHDQLQKAGIPGIKYLDGASRAAGQGSRNYVVFDDQLISIVKKYGIAGALGAGLINDAQARQLQVQGYQ